MRRGEFLDIGIVTGDILVGGKTTISGEVLVAKRHSKGAVRTMSMSVVPIPIKVDGS